MKRRTVFRLLATGAMGGAAALCAAQDSTNEQCASSHRAWVAEALQRMQTIQPGMTRKELLTVFTTEGGISTPLQRTYVSRDCQFFKVTVAFKPAGRAETGADGRISLVEGDEDVIVKLSQPFLEFSVMD